MKPRSETAAARSVQILRRSAIESGREEGREVASSTRRSDCAQIENNVAGVRSLIEDTPGGIATPEFASDFSRISCDSSISLSRFVNHISAVQTTKG